MVTDLDLKIYYSGNSYVAGRCHRWDSNDYSIVIETWLKKSDLLALQNNIRPGAVKEFKRVIFSPKYYDASWQGKNTLKIRPLQGTSLYKQRGSEKIGYVKNISSSPIQGPNGFLNCKIEMNISGSSI